MPVPIELLWCVGALFWWWISGAALVSLITRRLSRLEFHATAVAVGLGSVSLQLFAFGWFELPWRPSLIVLSSLPVIAAALVRIGFRARPTPASRPDGLGIGGPWELRPGVAELGALLVLGTLVIAAILTALLVPSGLTRNPDAYGFYLLKARMFYLDQGLTPYLRDHAQLLYTVPDHPMLIPLAILWLYLVTGGVHEQFVALLNPVFLLIMVGLFYAFTRHIGLRSSIGSVLTLLLGIRLLSYVHSSVAYTDLAVGVYLLLAVTCTVYWIQTRHADYALLGAIGLGLAGWTKNEGVAMYYAGTAAVAVLGMCNLLTKRKLDLPIGGCLILLVVPYALMIPWAFVKSAYAMQVGQLANLGGIEGLIDRVRERAAPLAGWLVIRAIVGWHALLCLAVAALVINARRGWIAATAPSLRQHRLSSAAIRLVASVDPVSLYTGTLMLLILAGFLGGLLTSPDTLMSLRQHVTPRLTDQLTPLFFVILAYQLGVAMTASRQGDVPMRCQRQRSPEDDVP
jgi:hypothetical protein